MTIENANAELRELSVQEYCERLELADVENGNYGHGDWVDDIYLMHTKFGVRQVVESLDREKLLKFLEFRLNFLQEELDEAKKAFSQLEILQTTDIHPDARTIAVFEAGDDVVDAMIDLCVVAIGTLDALRVDSYVAWSRVLEANMQKTPGIKPERPNPLGLPDLIKPEGWRAPSHLDNVGLLEKL